MTASGTQAAALPAAGESVERLFTDVWQTLMEVHPLAAGLVLLPLGIAFLLYGFRLYRWLVVIAYSLVGIVAGMTVARYIGFNQSIGIIVGSIVLGVLAWPLHRAGWGILGGAVFAVILWAVSDLAGVESRTHLYIIGGIAFVAGMAVTILLMKPLIMTITALLGAGFLAEGVVQVLVMKPSISQAVMRGVDANPYIATAIVLALAGVGIMLQALDTKKGKGKKKSGGDGG